MQSEVIPCILCHMHEHALNELHECGTWEEGGELGCSVVGWLYTLLACMYTVLVCHTVHVGVSMNTVPLYHCSSLLYVHLHCMLQFSHSVLIPPSSPSPCPFGGFPCDLSEVDLFRADKGHPVPSEFVVSSEGAAQPEGTQTEGGVIRTGVGVFVG